MSRARRHRRRGATLAMARALGAPLAEVRIPSHVTRAPAGWRVDWFAVLRDMATKGAA